MESEVRGLPNLFRIARDEAAKSTYRHQVGAVLVCGRRILSRGHNSVRYLSIGVNRYTKYRCSLHAERACLSRVEKNKIKGCDVYVYREFRNGKPAIAKPCKQCLYMLFDLGIRKIYFTISEYPYYEVIKL